MIKFSSNKQISINDFDLPFDGKLNPNNFWIILANNLPWDDMMLLYCKSMSSNFGRKAIEPRIAVGAIIIKHIKNYTDERCIEEIKENPFLQYFLGYSDFDCYRQAFAPSLFVSIRKRMSLEKFQKLNDDLIKHLHNLDEEKKTVLKIKKEDSDNQEKGKSLEEEKTVNFDQALPAASNKFEEQNIDSIIVNQSISEMAKKAEEKNVEMPNKGHLILDATVAPADIKYPTDLDLLNSVREKSEELIDLLFESSKKQVKPRTYRKKARKNYLALIKKRKKSKKEIRKGIRQQLAFIKRNLATINTLLDEQGSLKIIKHRLKEFWVMQEVYRQQKEMYEQNKHQIEHRIVSIGQAHVRPIVRGKAGKTVEFGAKISVSLSNGFVTLDRLSWDAYNETVDLMPQCEFYKKRFGYYPQFVTTDDIYGSQENRNFMKEKGITYTGKTLGRKKKIQDKDYKKNKKEKQNLQNKRVSIEGKFGVAKRRYDLDLVKAKLDSTSESWIASIIYVMNISKLVWYFFIIKLNELQRQLNTKITIQIHLYKEILKNSLLNVSQKNEKRLILQI